MALIECPECKNKISDQADVCPKCGYELRKTEVEEEEKTNASDSSKKPKANSKYILLAIIALCVFLVFKYLNDNNTTTQNTNQNTNQTQNQTQNQNPTQNNNYQNQTQNQNQNTSQNNYQSTTSGYQLYSSPYLGVSFEIPNGYKVATGDDGYIYVAKNIDNEGALIPYIVVGRYDNFSNETQFLNSFTEYMKKSYSDLKITIDLVSGVVGNKTVYGLAYNYTSSNHLVVDNRYAVLINNKVYMIGSKEENTNSAEINSVVEHIISTLAEGGN